MRKENIFDLYNEQHKNDVIEAQQDLPGIVKAEDINPDLIPGEERAAAASTSLTADAIPNNEPAGLNDGPAAGDAESGDLDNNESGVE